MENKTLINAIEGELREVHISLNAAERYIEQLRLQLNDKEEEQCTSCGVDYVMINGNIGGTEDDTRRARV